MARAKQVQVDATGFAGRLSTADDTTQKALATLDGIAFPSESVVAEWVPDNGGPNEVFISGTDAFVYEIVSGKGVVLNLELPENVDLAVNPVLEILYAVSATGGAGGTVAFALDAKYVAAGTENLNKVDDEALTSTPTVTNTLSRLHRLTFTLDRTKLAAGDGMTFHLQRTGGTFDGDIGIFRNAKFRFTGTT